MTHPIALHELHTFGVELLCRLGVRREDALVAADALVYADARGLGTHGIGALATIYGPRLLDGRIDPAASARTVLEHGATAVIDARGGLGLVAMTRAMDLAASQARRHGVGAVTVRHSSHFGAAGYYADRAAEAGCIGLAMTNCGTQGVVPPLGGTTRLLGTNPIGAAVPTGSEPPFVLDMSTSAVAAGKVAAARRAGTSVPNGWLAGPDGADADDPQDYYDGRADMRWLGGRLATGAAKGYGLGLLVDLLCGPLAGAGCGPRAEALAGGPPADDDDIGHVAIALDPAAFGSPDGFRTGVDDLLSCLRASPPAPGVPAVTYPGEPEARRAADAAALGATLPEHLTAPLVELAGQLGVPVPAALRSGHSETVATALVGGAAR
jgi:LDH2 family malate/lactate/ureidoglycolate dehydrogenase